MFFLSIFLQFAPYPDCFETKGSYGVSVSDRVHACMKQERLPLSCFIGGVVDNQYETDLVGFSAECQ